MGCRAVFRTVLMEAWRPLPGKSSTSATSFSSSISTPQNLRCGLCHNYLPKIRSFHIRKGIPHVNCSNHENPSSDDDGDQDPPQEAVLKAISEVSKAEGRVGQTTNVVIGGTVTDDSTNEWLALDKKVNSYPTVRGFTAIGTGGDDFVQAMVVAVESVIQQPIPEGQVKQKLSSRGKYVSVNIGPIQVVSSEQVQAVYNAMRRDDRMKYFL
ncbi:OLC1v1028579C1 [Oldenlandia corymbosa var. corymbosa]|uniref:OLC1v1028579C1 n=1 Tax=Oldenlandia corymbosa var. corymbosa TaxID=529605 RepID=A0AAV1CCJ3_OLDCO|nr:OLC1v1028579C1 [Oldenlandia corymbosa var. corymbosa]